MSVNKVISRYYKKQAGMQKLAHQAILYDNGLTKQTVRDGRGFMVYHIDTEKNHSKFYEGLVIEVPTGGYQVIRRWGRLTDSGATGRIDGVAFDHDPRFFFFNLRDAVQELNNHYKPRIRKGYVDAFGPYHKSPDGKKLPEGQYPVGLGAAGFGWGGQSITKCIPALRALVGYLDEAIQEIKSGDMTIVDRVAGPLEDALGSIRDVAYADSTMAKKLKDAIEKPIRRLQGAPRFLPDPEGKKLKMDLAKIRNYIVKQTSYCQ